MWAGLKSKFNHTDYGSHLEWLISLLGVFFTFALNYNVNLHHNHHKQTQSSPYAQKLPKTCVCPGTCETCSNIILSLCLSMTLRACAAPLCSYGSMVAVLFRSGDDVSLPNRHAGRGLMRGRILGWTWQTTIASTSSNHYPCLTTCLPSLSSVGYGTEGCTAVPSIAMITMSPFIARTSLSTVGSASKISVPY